MNITIITQEDDIPMIKSKNQKEPKNKCLVIDCYKEAINSNVVCGIKVNYCKQHTNLLGSMIKRLEK